MIAVTYRIQLEEPVLVTALSGDPNSAVSHSFIPGSVMRGLVAGQYLAQRPDQDLAKNARPVFFDGQTRFLNAYLCDAQWHRRLPASFSWRREKTRSEQSGPLEDHAVLDPKDTDFKPPKGPPKGVDGFAWLSDGEVSLALPNRHIAVHTLRDRDAGRPTGEHGALYRYDGLAPGERFVGAILAPSQQVAEELRRLLPEGSYNLGKAATAGYGRIFLHDVEVDLDWQECDMGMEAVGAGGTFVVNLLSDAILRDENGATHTDLAKALEDLSIKVTQERAFKAVAPVGGFNRTWGLPLAQTLALQGGSVFVFKAKAEIPLEAIQQLVKDGIGERRVEGYGRLAINWQEEETLQQVKAPDFKPPPPSAVDLRGDAELELLARRMATRRRRRELDRALVQAINYLRMGKKSPPNTQLARVRIIARSALAERQLGRIGDLFKRRVDNPYVMKETALKQFEAARIEGQRLSDWIIELADEPGKVWQKLRGSGKAKTLGEVEAEGGLAEEYAVRLIDGVLAKEMARRRKGGE